MSTLSINKSKISENIQYSWVNPRKFALWIAIACMTMMFAGFTSAYLVRRAAPNWQEFKLPINFYISAGIMLLSSVSIALAVRFFKREQLSLYRWSLFVTLILGVAFFYSQYLGWKKLQEIGVYVSGNPSGSFVYVITYVHVAHVIGGLLFLTIAWLRSIFLFRNPAQFLIYRTDGVKKVNIELLATYWHFVDVLWLYLLLFFTFS